MIDCLIETTVAGDDCSQYVYNFTSMINFNVRQCLVLSKHPCFQINYVMSLDGYNNLDKLRYNNESLANCSKFIIYLHIYLFFVNLDTYLLFIHSYK